MASFIFAFRPCSQCATQLHPLGWYNANARSKKYCTSNYLSTFRCRAKPGVIAYPYIYPLAVKCREHQHGAEVYRDLVYVACHTPTKATGSICTCWRRAQALMLEGQGLMPLTLRNFDNYQVQICNDCTGKAYKPWLWAHCHIRLQARQSANGQASFDYPKIAQQ